LERRHLAEANELSSNSLKGVKPHLQYGACDKFLSGVVGGRTAGESLAKVKRIVTDSPQKLELSAASPASGRCH